MLGSQPVNNRITSGAQSHCIAHVAKHHCAYRVARQSYGEKSVLKPEATEGKGVDGKRKILTCKEMCFFHILMPLDIKSFSK